MIDEQNLQGIVKPKLGWKPETIYIVEVKWNKSNVLHTAILHTGFISRNGEFQNYCEVWSNCYDRSHNAKDAYYLKALKRLSKMPNHY